MSALVQIGNPGLGARPGGEVRPLTGIEKALLAMVAVGTLLFAVAMSSPGKLSGSWAAPTMFGLIGVGGVGYFWSTYRGTTPGIKNHGVFHESMSNRGALAWIAGIALTGFYILLYWHASALEGGIRLLDPLSQALRGAPANQWFLYGFLYTLAVLVMGSRMAMKYRHNRYQLIRTASVSFFQLGFAFLLPGALMRLSGGAREPFFTYFWPLSPYGLWPGTVKDLMKGDTLGMTMLVVGVLAITVVTPTLTYFFGKRWYCSWVCGCGGLAETLGDPFRQLSDKSEKSWRIERWMIHSVLVAVVLVTAVLWADEKSSYELLGQISAPAKKWYGFLIGMAFSGVIGVGFYPIMGSRVWCRFGCPMAAILGFFQRFFSRFRITTNGAQCISCGNCSTYCEMGIDVRAYAQRGENIVRSSCVGCGVCAAVCPRGVLRLENGPRTDRFDGADAPLQDFLIAIRK